MAVGHMFWDRKQCLGGEHILEIVRGQPMVA